MAHRRVCAVTAMGLAWSVMGCQGTLLPAAYLQQTTIPPVAAGDETQPRGAPVRVYACQSAQTHHTYWVPEYSFRNTDDTDGFGAHLPDPPDAIKVPGSDGYRIDVLKSALVTPPPPPPPAAPFPPALPSFLRRDRGLQLCSIIESRSIAAAHAYERWGFVLAGFGAVGTAAFGFGAVSTASGAHSNTSELTGFASAAGFSALLTVLGSYLVARGADSWSAYGSADAAIVQMKPNDSDGNAALCSNAVQAWTTGRAASDAVSGGGGGGGGKGGGGGGGSGGGVSATASASAGGGGGGGAPPPSASSGGSTYPTCPSDVDTAFGATLPLNPTHPPEHPACGPFAAPNSSGAYPTCTLPQTCVGGTCM